ncbi:MAG: leucine-rich repeat domain-containing protein, partial [Spirochaetaceae bacterium]|nr:leucine-rich repeat domain-containing protein [Spirochaetaceae bacterium]
GLADVKSTQRGVRNVYQLIAVDESNPGAVWRFAETRVSGDLSADILKGHTYHFLFLGGHLEDAEAPVGPGNQPTLLVSGYLSKTMSAEAGASRFSLAMTPLVVDAAFVKNGAGGAATRQSGRLAKTVGLDEKTSYTFRVVLGGDEAGALGPDDALRAAKGNGVKPLIDAEAGVKGGATYWGDLSLLSNAASFNGDEIKDYNDANRTDSSKPHTTRGTAEYMLTTPQAGTATTASFKMEYAPFGLADDAWAGDKPVWVIRNGLNDNPLGPQGWTTASPGGALSVAVLDPTAARGPGLYEGNNPAPVEGVDAASADGLTNALTFLDANGDKARYGSYTIMLSAQPAGLLLPPIAVGDDVELVIDGTGAAIILPPPDDLFTPAGAVSYGNGITIGEPPEPVYDYLEHGSSCADLDGFIVANYAGANAVANPARVKIINAGGLGAQMASISNEVTAAGAYVSLDLSDASNSFAGTMPATIKTNAYVKGIALPVSVSNIDAGAFNYFASLATVSLPGVQTIGNNAFNNCTALATVSLPAAQTIGNGAFQNCTSLATADLPVAQTIGASAFQNCALVDVSLPVAQTIGDGAFSTCTSLATVSLPAAQTIGGGAFNKCAALVTVSLPAAQIIGGDAFFKCTSLVTVSLPAAQTIVAYAFDSCTALASVTLPDGVDIQDANAFPGKLISAYDAGGKLEGSYTRSPPSETWTKQ